jgi:uracil-DNA glycosylase
MAGSDSDVSDLVREAQALFRYQGELGLNGIDLPAEFLNHPASEAGSPTAEVATPPALLIKATEAAAALAEIRTVIGDCRRCALCKARTQVVFGVGDPRARLMFIGEGPGRDEDLQGEPFVGVAGQLLDKMIKAMGLSRQEVYIANVVKCRPPKNRDPEPAEVAQCEPFLKAQIAVVRPEAIVALGRCAAQTLLKEPTAITRLRGHWREYAGIPLMPTFHPAYLLRSPGEKRAAWQDLQTVMKRLQLSDPRQKP